jgi:hypothetical protein
MTKQTEQKGAGCEVIGSGDAVACLAGCTGPPWPLLCVLGALPSAGQASAVGLSVAPVCAVGRRAKRTGRQVPGDRLQVLVTTASPWGQAACETNQVRHKALLLHGIDELPRPAGSACRGDLLACRGTDAPPGLRRRLPAGAERTAVERETKKAELVAGGRAACETNQTRQNDWSAKRIDGLDK